MKSSLSPKDVALAIGVSESSLKRWADDGKLRVTKTLGGHRRIQVYDALRFARETQLPIQRPDILGMPELALADPEVKRDEAAAEQMFDLLKAGKAADVRGVMLDMYLKGESVAAICDGPIRAALYRMGELWGDDEQGILLEHRATDICIQALRELRPLVDPVLQFDSNTKPRRSNKPRLPVAVGSTPPGDPYRMTTLMVCLTLMEAGYEAVNLGPDIPYAMLIHAAREHKASIVWLSATAKEHSPEPDGLIELAEALGDRVTLALGGQALPTLPAVRPGNIMLCTTLSELSAFVQGRLRV